MLKATLIVSQPGQATQEVESGESVMSIGSALDNIVCLEDDAGVARYHAVIERHGDEFRLSDLGTRQGTKLNGQAVFDERELTDGDRITLGDSVAIEFYAHEASTPRPASGVSSHSPASSVNSEVSYAVGSTTSSGISTASSNVSSSVASAAAGATSTAAVAAPTAASSPVSPDNSSEGMSPTTKALIGVGGGLLLTATAAVVIFNPFGGGCGASVRILTPPSGTTLRSATTIRVEARESACIKRVSYQLDGEEIASASNAPYEATLDPRRLPRMSAGNHVLTATIETTDGAQARQSGEIYVAFNAANGVASNAATPAPPTTETTSEPPSINNANASLITGTDVQAMAERLASQLSGKSGYVFERKMINEVQARTSNFSAAGALERAARHRRTVVKAFSDRGIRPLLGFVLALSRSGFEEAASREGASIWRVPANVAQGYLQPGESVAALDNPQRAAEISAVYLKDLLGVFETENFDLAVACYGSTLEEAGALKQRVTALPAGERRNFWGLVERNIVSREQSERVVKFYAAGIVGENPQRFGAADDRRLSALEY
jgi:pSer/pThr/pTyr-binding forkhead associated (FHA) protein